MNWGIHMCICMYHIKTSINCNRWKEMPGLGSTDCGMPGLGSVYWEARIGVPDWDYGV